MEPDLIVNLVMDNAYLLRRDGVRIAQGSLIHRLARYHQQRAVFEFFCEEAYCGDAHAQHETFEDLTCVACLARMPWFRLLAGG